MAEKIYLFAKTYYDETADRTFTAGPYPWRVLDADLQGRIDALTADQVTEITALQDVPGQLSGLTELVLASGAKVYASKSEMDADNSNPARTPGLVLHDSSANNGLYSYSTLQGAWVKSSWQVPSTSDLNALALKSVAIQTAAPLIGGGDLSQSRTITVQRATSEEARAFTTNDKVLTPFSLAQALDAYGAGLRRLAAASTDGQTFTADSPLGVDAYEIGDLFIFSTTADNTGAATIEIDDFGAIDLTDDGGVALEPGAIKSGVIYLARVSGGVGSESLRILFNPQSVLATDAELSTGQASDKAVSVAQFSKTSGYALAGVGAAQVHTAPNLFTDDLFESFSGWGGAAPARAFHAGRWCAYLANDTYWSPPIARSSLGAGATVFSAAIAVQSRAVPASAGRVLVQQFSSPTGTSNEVEVARHTIDLDLLAWTSPRLLTAEALALHEDCVSIRIYFDFRADAYVSDMSLSSGAMGGIRPVSDRPRLTALETGAELQRQDRAASYASPNVIPDAALLEPYGPSGFDFVREVNAAGVPMLTLANGGGSGFDGPSWLRRSIKGDTYNAGVTLFYAQNENLRVLIRQLDASGSEIRDLSDGNGDYRHEFDTGAALSESAPPRRLIVKGKAIAPTCVSLQMLVMPNSSGVKVGEFWCRAVGDMYTPVTPALARLSAPVYVAVDGDDQNTGIEASPFATLSAALQSGARRVVVEAGVYDATALNFTGADLVAGGAEIVAKGDGLALSRGGQEVTGFVATVGRTNVYQASLSTAPARWDASTPKGFLFVKSAPFGLIASGERHPLHRGRSHQMPHTPLRPAESLDALEAATYPAWFYSSGIVYVLPPSGVDPLAMTVVSPQGDAISGLSKRHRLAISGLGWEFMGLDLRRIGAYDLEGLWLLGAPTNALTLIECSGVDRYTTILGCGNDGVNVHNTTGGATDLTGYSEVSSFTRSVEPYCAWAFDEARSLHERCVGSVEGGLFEDCGSGGVAAASGAEEVLRGLIVRRGGWDNDGFQGAIATTNTVIDDGTGTSLTAYGCIVEGASAGFDTRFANDFMSLHDCRTYNCTVAALRAVAGSQFIARNHLDIGSAATKAGDGTITIQNGTLVT